MEIKHFIVNLCKEYSLDIALYNDIYGHFYTENETHLDILKALGALSGFTIYIYKRIHGDEITFFNFYSRWDK